MFSNEFNLMIKFYADDDGFYDSLWLASNIKQVFLRVMQIELFLFYFVLLSGCLLLSCARYKKFYFTYYIT